MAGNVPQTGGAAPQTPYKLDLVQATQASKVLLRHISEKKTQSSTQNLLLGEAGGDEDDESAAGDQEAIWLIITTKKHIVDQKRLKPNKIQIPHSLNTSPASTICLITADPQNTYTTLVDSPAFPAALRSRITRTISLTHLKKNHSTFESRRALYATHDIFLADDRIVTHLPGTLGKIFYKGGAKRPIPIHISEAKEKDEQGKRIKLDPATARPVKDKEEGGRGAASPQSVAREIEKALGCAVVHLAPGTTTSIKVALSGMTPAQVTENISAVVDGVVEKFVTKGWRNIRAIHIKAPNSTSFPIWLADDLWTDDADVLEEKKTFGKKSKKGVLGAQDGEVGAIEDAEGAQGTKRKAGEIKKPTAAKHAKKKRKLAEEEKLAEELASRKSSLKKQKAEALALAV